MFLGLIKNEVTNIASHRIFFSFEYNKDYWRAVQIRNLGKASVDSVFPDQAWEKVRVNTNDGKIFSSGTNNILNKRRFYQLRNLNEDERKFLEFLMECLKVNKATKVEMRRHIELYLTPYKFKYIVDMAKMINPVPVNHPLNQKLQSDFENVNKILEEGIVNTGEDVYMLIN